MSKQLQIHRDSDRAAIQSMLDAAYGKIETVLTVDDLRKAAKEPFARRLMLGATMRVEASESLPKAYKYHKEIGVASMRHTGKCWVFESAGRGTCWAGSSTGGYQLTMRADTQIEVTQDLLDRASIKFAFQPAPTLI